MAKAKPKKVFYNRRYKLPPWAQLYAVWSVVALATLVIIFFTSVERIANEPAPALTLTANGFAEGLFYELRDAEPGTQIDITRAYARRLEKKHGYKSRDENFAGCKAVRIAHGDAPRYGITAVLTGEKSQNIFALLTFLDRIVPQNAAAAVEAIVIFPGKNCDPHAAAIQTAKEDLQLPILLETGESELNYDRVYHFKNLKLRRHFESAFFMRERTLWANLLAVVSTDAPAGLTLPVKAAWTDDTSAMLTQNPLLKHPLVAKIPAANFGASAALYLTGNIQLMKGGFIAICVLVWLLAALPFVNALGTFREKFDLSSTLTSGILYSTAFLVYLLVLKLILRFAKADFASTLLAVILLPVVYFPINILQKTLLRAEINRAGVHFLIQILLTVGLVFNPLTALAGLVILLGISAFSRATLMRKVLRLAFILLLFAAFFIAARQPLGNFTNFLSALLPVFTFSNVPEILLLCLICGNLVALFFVPRERV